MADKTGIEWTEATWNPVVGCDHVSAGCDNCYAARDASGRLAHMPQYAGLAVAGRFTGEARLLPERLAQPLAWRRPRRIFVNSMSDLFHKDIPDEYIARVFAVMAATPHHTFQVLTKRHARMRSLLSGEWGTGVFADAVEETMGEFTHASLDQWPLPNVWLGVSVETQGWADIRIPALLRTPAAVRFLSCEPLLGPVDLTEALVGYCAAHDFPGGFCIPRTHPGVEHIAWVIAGGESGPGARPMHPAWARQLRDQCEAAGVPFLFKQWGEYLPVRVENREGMFGGRGFQHPGGGWSAPVIRERSGGSFRSGRTRLMVAGDETRGGVMLDADTIALRVGKRAAGRLLDGRTWDQYPTSRTPAPPP